LSGDRVRRDRRSLQRRAHNAWRRIRWSKVDFLMPCLAAIALSLCIISRGN
jgi:hypothetical protein